MNPVSASSAGGVQQTWTPPAKVDRANDGDADDRKPQQAAASGSNRLLDISA